MTVTETEIAHMITTSYLQPVVGFKFFKNRITLDSLTTGSLIITGSRGKNTAKILTATVMLAYMEK